MVTSGLVVLHTSPAVIDEFRKLNDGLPGLLDIVQDSCYAWYSDSLVFSIAENLLLVVWEYEIQLKNYLSNQSHFVISGNCPVFREHLASTLSNYPWTNPKRMRITV